MPYIRTRKRYRQKPPGGVKPNLGHPLLAGADYYYPCLPTSGDYSVINEVNKSETASPYSGAKWSTDGLYSNGDNECLLSDSTITITTNQTWSAQWHYKWNGATPVWVYHLYVGGYTFFSIYFNNNFTAVYVHGVSESLPSWATAALKSIRGVNVGASQLGTAFKFYINGRVAVTKTKGAAASTDFLSLGGRDDGTARHGAGSYDGFIMSLGQEWPAGRFEDYDRNRWEIYSRPLPIWISSGAAPPAWNNTMNEISAPGAVNEITNANIQSVNEI